jgi:hypothetical protein
MLCLVLIMLNNCGKVCLFIGRSETLRPVEVCLFIGRSETLRPVEVCLFIGRSETLRPVEAEYAMCGL